MKEVIFYQSNGISVDNFEDIAASFYIQENIGQRSFDSRFFYKGDSINYELGKACVDLYNLFTEKVFINMDDYYRYIEWLPLIINKAGLDSDCNMSKEDLQQVVEGDLFGNILNNQRHGNLEDIFKSLNKNKYKYLYLSDCQSLINSIQELLQTCMSNFVFFYKLLCELEGPRDFCDDYYNVSTEGRIIISVASNIFISLYSIFDIITKLAYELENMRECDDSYPKLASRKILFGDKKHLKITNIKGTIFEKNRTISIVENLRNELVHNAVWEMNSKIFFHLKKGNIIDKTIYFPDFSDEGHLVAYKNRKRFFSNGIKLNEELPILYFETLQRIKITLERLIE